MKYESILNSVYGNLLTIDNIGSVAAYIPELAKVSPEYLGAYVHTLDGQQAGVGDFDVKFSIQSIAKVLSLCLIYRNADTNIWNRVGVEPSGSSFNSLVQLEYDKGIPRNPMINAGAIVVCDMIISTFKNYRSEVLTFVRELAQCDTINYNETVARSELSVGYRNISLVNLMKSFGNIENDIDEVLEFYFLLSSIEMTCQELSRTFLFLANDGKEFLSDRSILSLSQSKRVNAIMQTCGFYDEAGEFSFQVGLPGKSGVGGGIVAVHPDNFSIAVWSPKLNAKGNSYRGFKFLERFTTDTGLSVF